MLNFCRQFARQCYAELEGLRIPKERGEFLRHLLSLMAQAQKFILPNGGRTFDDKELRAIDETDQLRLPYPVIALEYLRTNGRVDDGCFRSSKALVLAREAQDCIAFAPIAWHDEMRQWLPLPEAAIPMDGYLDRSYPIDGRVSIKICRTDERLPYSDYEDEMGAILCLVNALRCSNVHVDRVEQRNAQKAAALGFDSYHVLTVSSPGVSGDARHGGTNRSPREHLRRGHIRRLHDRRIWVNAAVVAAGSNKIYKDYAIAA